MRIISGKFKSRRINTKHKNLYCIKSNFSDFRPTTDRAKEMLFNVLNNIIDFKHIRCLDLFAGSGSLGFEAISRGAQYCEFVENSAACISLIKKTADELDCNENINIIKQDVETYLKYRENNFYDLIFADPPYSYINYTKLISLIMKLRFSVFALEYSLNENFIYDISSYEILEKRAGVARFKIFISKE